MTGPLGDRVVVDEPAVEASPACSRLAISLIPPLSHRLQSPLHLIVAKLPKSRSIFV
jgi:hypothetical protein